MYIIYNIIMQLPRGPKPLWLFSFIYLLNHYDWSENGLKRKNPLKITKHHNVYLYTCVSDALPYIIYSRTRLRHSPVI